MKFVVDDAVSFTALQKRELPPDVTHVSLRGPFTDDRLERRVNSSYFSCGCEEGSVAVLLALFVSTFGAITSGLDGTFTWWRIVAYVGAAALGGKGLGLALARIRLRRACQELERMSHLGERFVQYASG